MSINMYASHRKCNGPVMSACTWANRSAVDERICFLTLPFWHDTRVFDKNRISNFLWGYTNLSVTILIDALAIGQDKLCRVKKTVRRKVYGMKGRNRSVLMSHTISNSVFGTRISKDLKNVELFWKRFWFFDCSFTIDWYSMNRTSRKALMPRHMVSEWVFSVPLTEGIPDVNCIR